MGLGENQNLLNDGIYNASVKGIHPITGFEQACTLVEYGKKYHPVKKYAIERESFYDDRIKVICN